MGEWSEGKCYVIIHFKQHPPDWLLEEQKEYIENRVQNQVYKTKSSFPSI